MSKLIEPKFSALEFSRVDLVKGMNFYAQESDPDMQKEWSLVWLAKHRPDMVDSVSKAKAWDFNTFGSLCRMEAKGFIHSKETTEKIVAHFAGLASQKNEPVQVIEKKEKKAEPFKMNLMELQFNDNIDSVLRGEKPIVLTTAHGSNPTKGIVNICKSEIENIESTPDAYTKKTRKALLQYFTSTLASLQSSSKKAKSVVVRKKKINPAKIVAKVKYCRRDEETGLESAHPVDLIGARKAYVYDCKRRKLIAFVSNVHGFTFKGMSLKNVDFENSKSKTIRKPKEVFKAKAGIRELNATFDKLSTKEYPVSSSTFNDRFVIVKIA